MESERRPWGRWHVLDAGAQYKVKRIHVDVGCRLSYQSHDHRAEHWVVVSGIARVLIDGRSFDAGVGQTVDVPVGVKHRLANAGAEELVVVEVQHGSRTDEDDITRFEDDYGRDEIADPTA